jgi:hypothetical protein
MTGLVWCKGRTTKPNGIKINWDDLAVILGSAAAKKAALRGAHRPGGKESARHHHAVRTDNGPHMDSWPAAGVTWFRSEKDTNWEGAFQPSMML